MKTPDCPHCGSVKKSTIWCIEKIIMGVNVVRGQFKCLDCGVIHMYSDENDTTPKKRAPRLKQFRRFRNGNLI